MTQPIPAEWAPHRAMWVGWPSDASIWFEPFEQAKDEVEALVREFGEETGLAIQPSDRIAEAGQYFVKSTGEALNNVGGYWTARVIVARPEDKCEDDHTLVWLEPAYALSRLRHDAHAWAVVVWMRR